jgi:flagellar biosynthetic protein FliO
MNLQNSNPRVGQGNSKSFSVLIAWAATWFPARGFAATVTNILSAPLSSPSLPDAGPSLLRVLGSLALVLGIFLGGVWLLRNGRFSNFARGRTTRLNVLESRSLGSRQALYVVAYNQERFLIGSTPAGINLLSHLASSPEPEAELPSQATPNPSFSMALAQVLRGQRNPPDKSGDKK